MIDWKRLRKKPKLIPYPPKDRVKTRAEKRNLAREAKLAGKVAANFQPKKPRPKQEPVVHVVSPRTPKARGVTYISRSERGDIPLEPQYVSSRSGYRSRQKQASELNKVAKEGTTAKSRRANRQSASKARKAVAAKELRQKTNRKG